MRSFETKFQTDARVNIALDLTTRAEPGFRGSRYSAATLEEERVLSAQRNTILSSVVGRVLKCACRAFKVMDISRIIERSCRTFGGEEGWSWLRG